MKPRVRIFYAHLTSGTYYLAMVRSNGSNAWAFNTEYHPTPALMWQNVERGLRVLR